MGTLFQNEIWERINISFSNKKSLIITPLLSKKQIGVSSIDLRLGNDFIIVKKRTFSQLNLEDDFEKNLPRYFDKIRVDRKSDIVLHPQQLILGSTLEFIKIPCDTNAYVIGRSTWGRMGLVIATAINVDPGFRGCITLELVNTGEVPFLLKPGLEIAQLVLHKSDTEASYDGKYSSSTAPGTPKFQKPSDWNFWCKDKE